MSSAVSPRGAAEHEEPRLDQLAALAGVARGELVAVGEGGVDRGHDLRQVGVVGGEYPGTAPVGLRGRAGWQHEQRAQLELVGAGNGLADRGEQRRGDLVHPLEGARDAELGLTGEHASYVVGCHVRVQAEPRPGVVLPAGALVGEEQRERADLLGGAGRPRDGVVVALEHGEALRRAVRMPLHRPRHVSSVAASGRVSH
jgi:hypothetical protein